MTVRLFFPALDFPYPSRQSEHGSRYTGKEYVLLASQAASANLGTKSSPSNESAAVTREKYLRIYKLRYSNSIDI